MSQNSAPLKPVGTTVSERVAEASVDESDALKRSSASSQRYSRYKAVIEFASLQPRFELVDIKHACCSENPGFVTRIVNELEQHGWIVRESSDSKSYAWNPGRKFSVNRWLDEKLFGTQIKESPEQERPRERLLSSGVENLTSSELIAILIRSGRPGESAVMAGQKIAKSFDGRLEDLPAAGRAELKEISCAVEKTAYCQIMAGIELGRRVAARSDDQLTVKISSSSDAIEFCQRFFARLISDAKQEEFHIVTLDTKNQVIDTHQVTVGTLDASLVHPREVFRPAIKDAASSVILVHNHPSGDPTPSREDIAVTTRLTESGKLIGIDVLDHIVLGRGSSVSIQESM
jgi:DNA repair protein RadC